MTKVLYGYKLRPFGKPYSITDELRAQLKVMNRQFHFYVKQKNGYEK